MLSSEKNIFSLTKYFTFINVLVSEEKCLFVAILRTKRSFSPFDTPLLFCASLLQKEMFLNWNFGNIFARKTFFQNKKVTASASL